MFKLKKENVYIDKGYFVGGSKTEAGKNRIVPILAPIKEYVKYFYDRNNYFLIETTNHCQQDVSAFRKKRFYPFLIEIGILTLPKGKDAFTADCPARLTPYSARHTLASMSVINNVKPEILQVVMGHADYSTTVNNYEKFSTEEIINEMQKVK